jgi:hypothetical protein
MTSAKLINIDKVPSFTSAEGRRMGKGSEGKEEEEGKGLGKREGEARVKVCFVPFSLTRKPFPVTS